MAIEPAVHVAGMKEPEQALFALGGFEHGVAVGDEFVAGVFKQFDVVGCVFSFGPCNGLRQEVGRAASEQNLGLDVVEHAHDIGLVGAPARVRHDGCRGGVFELSVAHDADGHVGFAPDEFCDGFLTGIILRGLGAVDVHAQGVDGGLVSGHVGRGRVGAVGCNGVHRACAQQRHVRHVVHCKRCVVHTVDDALAHDAGCRAVSNAQAVGDQKNHVFGLTLFRSGVEIPDHCFCAAFA